MPNLAEKKYTELYDFAPSGYLTLNANGEIAGLNLMAANILGKERSLLIKRNLDYMFPKIPVQATIIFSILFSKVT
jgi:PAS domain-containing protein